MKNVWLAMVALAFPMGKGVAAPVQSKTVQAKIGKVALPSPLTGAEMVKCLDFAEPVALKREKDTEENIFILEKALWSYSYYAEKQTPCLFSLELYRAQSLSLLGKNIKKEFLKRQRQIEQDLPAKRAEMEKRLKKEIGVQTRPNGREVFFLVASKPEGAFSIAFSTIGPYAVVLTQLEINEAKARRDIFPKLKRKKALLPRQHISETFARLEKQMPEFSEAWAAPSPAMLAARNKKSAGPPLAPVGAVLARAFDFSGPVQFKVEKTPQSILFAPAKPIWVYVYSAEKQTPYYYKVELYPAHALLGSDPKKEEQLLGEQVMERQDKINSIVKAEKEARGLEAKPVEVFELSSGVEFRDDERKVFQQIYNLGLDGRIVAFSSTFGKYDVAVTQFFFSGDKKDKTKKMVSPRKEMSEAFQTLERLIPNLELE